MRRTKKDTRKTDMEKKMKILSRTLATFITSLFLLGVAATTSFADQKIIMADDPNLAKLGGTYDIDPSHAHAGFTVSHLGFTAQNGQFDTISGKLTLDPANPKNSSVNITIDAASIDSGWDARDDHLRNEDFFNVDKYPEITFVSTQVKPTGKKTAIVTGNLTILGISKPVDLQITLNKAAPHPFKKDKFLVGFSGTATIKRSDWGMTRSIPGVGDEVKIRIEVEAFKIIPKNS